jgi:hypothetical protein
MIEVATEQMHGSDGPLAGNDYERAFGLGTGRGYNPTVLDLLPNHGWLPGFRVAGICSKAFAAASGVRTDFLVARAG